MGRLFNRTHRFRGQGMVEFALVLPVFLAITLGTIELGWLVFANHTLTNATREGARYAMVHGQRSGDVATVSTVAPVVQDFGGRFASEITVTNVEFTPDTAEPGSQVLVETSYDHAPIIGMIIGAGTINLTSSSTVIVQY
ncbi:MAG: pilus assembly protein [Sphaerobacteraceae bacterium]|nr:MAG: pilus assembly protein [Sphaerobacteraceae bacterium]